MMIDYSSIQSSIERAVFAAQEELAFLQRVKADQNIIDSLQADILNLNEASEIVWMYAELDK
jgi:hypothetical protein